MTDDSLLTEDQPYIPLPDLPPPSPYHAICMAAGSIVQCLPLHDHPEHIDALADELNRAIIAEEIFDMADSTLLLAVQARVLDTIFNRCIMTAFRDKGFDSKAVKIGLNAQRQCASSIEKLKKNRIAEQKLRIMPERTGGRRKY